MIVLPCEQRLTKRTISVTDTHALPMIVHPCGRTTNVRRRKHVRPARVGFSAPIAEYFAQRWRVPNPRLDRGSAESADWLRERGSEDNGLFWRLDREDGEGAVQAPGQAPVASAD